MIKVVIIQAFLPPYRIGLFNALGQFDDIELHIMLLSSKKKNKPEWDNITDNAGFNKHYCKGIHLRLSHERTVHINHDVIKILVKLKPDLIIFGGFNISSFQAVIYSKLAGIPCILWSEATKYTEQNVSYLRYKFRQWIAKKSTSFLSAGKMASDYLNTLLKEKIKKPIFVGYNSVDVNLYQIKKSQISNNDLIHFKKKFSGKVLLFVGQFIERKGVIELFEVYKELYKKQEDINLIMLGSGPMENKLKSYINDYSLKNIFFPGFINQNEIAKYFAVADIFILLSHYDCNPLVIYEALSFGLPIIASKQVGNTPEFVQDGINGFVADYKDITYIEQKVDQILSDDDLLKIFSKNSLLLSKNVSHEKVAKTFYDAIQNTLHFYANN
ncbi:MAG: glycosyltransferase family 4 protein [Calditrichaceae bacterium]|nr:glycosyltransferase family 4 protein [Calditrichaceae bacterium]MBN2707492.1 glycosyltransferase family 4 protein [Calditrichaceae bacterium]RQV95583.1 MAG: glycosyltransferase family 1 protein [Calditrichota bacterium]